MYWYHTYICLAVVDKLHHTCVRASAHTHTGTHTHTSPKLPPRRQLRICRLNTRLALLQLTQCYTIPCHMCYKQPSTKSIHNYNRVTVLVDAVPMTERHKNIISSKYEKLVNLNADGVMMTLITQEIITFEDKEDINSEKTRTKKAEALLALLRRKEDRAYYALIDALKKSGSPDLARILEVAGGIVIVVN